MKWKIAQVCSTLNTLYISSNSKQHPYFFVVKHMNVTFFQKARNEKKMKIWIHTPSITMTNKNNALKKLICNRPICSCYVPPADLAGFSPIIFLIIRLLQSHLVSHLYCEVFFHKNHLSHGPRITFVLIWCEYFGKGKH